MHWKVIVLFIIIAVIIRYIMRYVFNIPSRHSYLLKEQYIDMKNILNPTPSAIEANESFRRLVTFLERNPTDAEKFLTYIQQQFFETPCPLKDPSKWGKSLTGSTDFRMFAVSAEEEKKATSIK